MTEPFESVLLNPPKEVDIVAIERELSALWKQAAEPASVDQAPPVVRACSLNLIVVSRDRQELDSLGNIIGDVTLEHPARTFLISADRTSSPTLDAWISARCSLPVPGGKQVCCEQINLVAGGNEIAKITSIVTSLLVPDVPSVLVWRDKVRTNDQLFSSLSRVMDRVVMDSALERDPGTSFRLWERNIRENEGRASFGDLGWTHLTPMRNMLAHVFQPRETRPHLFQIDALSITYSSSTNPFHSGLSQAILLVGWLAQRMRWIPIHPLKRTDVTMTAKLRFDETAIKVRLIEGSLVGHSGGVIGVHLQTTSGVEISLAATGSSHCVKCTISDGKTNQHEMLTSGEDLSDSFLLGKELEVMQRDRLYEDVLKTLLPLLEENEG